MMITKLILFKYNFPKRSSMLYPFIDRLEIKRKYSHYFILYNRSLKGSFNDMAMMLDQIQIYTKFVGVRRKTAHVYY